MAKRYVIRGEPHSLVVMKVVESDAQGRPRKLEVIYDEESVAVKDGFEFITAYVPEKVVAKRTN